MENIAAMQMHAEPVANCNDPSGGAVVTELEVELGGADSVGVG